MFYKPANLEINTLFTITKKVNLFILFLLVNGYEKFMSYTKYMKDPFLDWRNVKLDPVKVWENVK